MIEELSEHKQWEREKMLGTGYGKTGKTTFALYAPQPILHLLYDFRDPILPPGVDPTGIRFKKYSSLEAKLEDDKFDRPRNVGDEIIRDAKAVQAAFKDGSEWLVMDGQESPVPRTIILDGADAVAEAIENRMLNIAGKRSPDEFTNSFTPCQLRLRDLSLLYGMLIPLPCNVIILTGPSEETVTVNNKPQKTGAITPDLGGKLDMTGPRKVDSSLYFHAVGDKFYVRTKSNAMYKGFGINRYGVPENVDVTLELTNGQLRPGSKTPWQKVWNR
jgi:hypothetical protein